MLSKEPKSHFTQTHTRGIENAYDCKKKAYDAYMQPAYLIACAADWVRQLACALFLPPLSSTII